MFHRQLVLTLGTVVHDGFVQTFALEIVLDHAATLDWRVDAYETKAAEKAEEGGKPSQDSQTGTFSLDFCQSVLATIRTSQL